MKAALLQYNHSSEYVANVLGWIDQYTAAAEDPDLKNVTGKVRTVIEAALSQRGVPYSWGGGNASGKSYGFCCSPSGKSGASIKGFDCSGLTTYAYAKVGIRLPRTAAAQAGVAKRIPASLGTGALKPGDLVFYATAPGHDSTIYHVGIYLGSGQMVNARARAPWCAWTPSTRCPATRGSTPAVTTTSRSPRLPLLTTVLLAVAGVALLGMPHGQEPTAPATRVTVHAATDWPSAAAPLSSATRPSVQLLPRRRLRRRRRPSSPLCRRTAKVAGDRAIQRNLEAAWPAYLPAADERTLLTAGRTLLRADAIGVGREKWPTVFGDSRQAVAPAFATARFRIQAAIARRDGSPNRAVVHLVWGMDRGGTFTDLRITDWFFTRTIKKEQRRGLRSPVPDGPVQ
ncbi:C40 family peptidase [Streptomyces thermocarboxydus]